MKLNKALLLRSNLDPWAPASGLLSIFLSCSQRRLAVPVCCEGCISEKSAHTAVCGPVAPGVVPGDPGLLHFRHSSPRWAGVWATEKASRAAGVSEGIGFGIKRKEIGFSPYYQLQPILMWWWILRSRKSGPGFCSVSCFFLLCIWLTFLGEERGNLYLVPILFTPIILNRYMSDKD